jgi:hypothetical protein
MISLLGLTNHQEVHNHLIGKIIKFLRIPKQLYLKRLERYRFDQLKFIKIYNLVNIYLKSRSYN